MTHDLAEIRARWVREKQLENVRPIVQADGAAIAADYDGPQIVRWFFLEDEERTSYLHGPRRSSSTILGSAPLPLARPLLHDLRQRFPGYTFYLDVEPPLGEEVTEDISINWISLSFGPVPSIPDRAAIYDAAVARLTELGEQAEK